jgi:predicted dehydrogenase
MIRVGIVGYGYWGPNVFRNFNGLENAEVVAVCDRRPAVLQKVGRSNPSVRLCNEPQQILQATDIDVVAVVTPVSTHYELAREALENGKHVFVEKPLTATSRQAEELVELADRKHLQIMVDHTFIFTGAVQRIKDMVDNGVLGKIYYYDSTRVNLGLFQHDINVIWDLAPHDFSIMNYLLEEQPIAVSASGVSHVNGLEDVAYVSVHFASSLIAHFNLNWLSPVKVRNTLIGGERRMIVWNDLAPDEKVRVYDKGIDVTSRQGVYELLVSYRSGDMWAPRIEQTEALAAECAHFLSCIEQDRPGLNTGYQGLQVVRLLEACSLSLRNNGETVELAQSALNPA